ncbi:MAG: TonB-dependent receptor [Parvularcula sp.]
MRSVLLRGASLAAFAIAHPAFAQEAPDASIDVIIVHGEKRDTDLQDVSQALSVIDGRELDRMNINDPDQLTNFAPSFVFTKQEGTENTLTIRGLGRNDTQSGSTSPSVAYHQDGIFQGATVALNANMLDVDRIEILRGPQGTVFGQNAIGGVVNLITHQPVIGETSGSLTVGVGNHNHREGQLIGNLGLADNFAVRLAAQKIDRDGYTRNILLNQDLDDADDLAIRISALWQASERLSVTARHEYTSANTGGYALKSPYDPNPDPYIVEQDSPSSYDFESNLSSMEIAFDTDDLTAKFLASHQRVEDKVVQDSDYGARRFNNFLNPSDPTGATTGIVTSAFLPQNDTTTTTNTVEVNVASKGDRLIDWIIGGLYYDEAADVTFIALADFNRDGALQTVDQLTPSDPFNPVLNPDLDFATKTVDAIKTWAAYAQGTLDVTKKLAVTAGLRYNDAEVTRDFVNFFTLPREITGDSDSFLTGRLGIEYKPTDAANLYANYTRGRKPGSGNLTFGQVVGESVDGEIVDAYEVGLKSLAFNERARINLAAFHYDFKNYQLLIQDPIPVSGGVVNVPKSRIDGAEIEATALVNDRLRIDMHASYLDTEIESDFFAIDGIEGELINAQSFLNGVGLFSNENIAARAAIAKNLRGNPLPNSPKTMFSATATQKLDLRSAHDLTVSVNWRWQDDFFARAYANPDVDRVESYGTLNASAEWDVGPWSLELNGTNLTDSEGVNTVFTDRFAVSSPGIVYAPPRVVRFRATYSF